MLIYIAENQFSLTKPEQQIERTATAARTLDTSNPWA
jgi:hypothetical protein